MGDYSKITAMRIKNFRCLGDVTIDFTASPIISLVAPNEAGKTSVIKAMISLMYNSDQRKSKNRIRTGTNGYDLLMAFEDGHVVERARTESANIYRLFENGKLVSENLKLDNGEIPPEIKKLMGVIEDEETGELMNIRTYEDMLLFVLSKASDNYKTMYNALKVENITKAMKNGKSEAAVLKNDISGTEISIASFNEQIKAMKIVDVTPVVNMRERVSAELGKLNSAYNILSRKNRADEMERRLGLMGEIAKASEINLVVASLLNAISNEKNRYERLVNDISKSKDVEALENIDHTKISKLEGILSRLSALKELEEACEASKDIDSVEHVNINSIEKMNSVMAYKKRVEALETSSNLDVESLSAVKVESVEKMKHVLDLLQKEIDNKAEVETHERELDEAVEALKKLGHYDEELGGFVKQCDNCGETVVVTLNELEVMV